MAEETQNPEALKEQEIGSRYQELMTGRMARHGQYMQATTAALRARGQLIQEEVAKERFAMQQQEQDLNRIKALTEITKQRIALQQKANEQMHVQRAVSKLGELHSDDPEYMNKMAGIFNENPMATRDPVIQDIIKNQMSERETQQKTANSLKQFREEEEIRNTAANDREKLLTDARATTAERVQAAKEKASADAKRGIVPGQKPPQPPAAPAQPPAAPAQPPAAPAQPPAAPAQPPAAPAQPNVAANAAPAQPNAAPAKPIIKMKLGPQGLQPIQ